MKLPWRNSLMVLIGICVILAPSDGGAGDVGPGMVQLDSLAELYQPVVFDHTMHVDLADARCSVCHHHTTGESPRDNRCAECHRAAAGGATIACRDCHPAQPFSAEYLARLNAGPQPYHLDKPGLKGAYHRNCLGCHRENGGPVGCQDCHPRTGEGDAFFRAGAAAAISAKENH